VTAVGYLLGPEHAGHDAVLRSITSTWEGNDEIEARRFTCSCGARVVVEIRTDVGPPSGKIDP